ncbi:hypothetical protein ABYF32_06615 [Buchananella felis]|uniref:hypothetical protein n=1 Tax=Buchananella felis TaxID=3231492 RepID=UPI003528E026
MARGGAGGYHHAGCYRRGGGDYGGRWHVAAPVPLAPATRLRLAGGSVGPLHQRAKPNAAGRRA